MTSQLLEADSGNSIVHVPVPLQVPDDLGYRKEAGTYSLSFGEPFYFTEVTR